MKRLCIALALSAVAVSSAFAQKDRTFVMAISTDPPGLNSFLTTAASTILVQRAMYEGLIFIDKDFKPEPALATEWSSNEDATRYSFKLRQDAKWHDGAPFTAADVKFTFEKLVPLSPTASAFGRLMKSVTTPDDYTVEVEFSQPYAPFIEALSGLPVLPKHVFENGDIPSNPANMAPIGTGPFKFVSYKSGDSVIVERDDNYRGPKPEVDRIVFKVLPDVNSRLLALRTGEIDFIANTDSDKRFYTQFKDNPNFGLLPDLGSPQTLTLFANTRTGPLADPKVRRAVYQAIDREAISEKAYYGYAVPAKGPIPSSIAWAQGADVNFAEQLPYDPEAANKMLDEAGFPKDANGRRFTLRIAMPSPYSSVVQAAGVVASNLSDVGITVEQQALDFTVWTERTFKAHDFDLSMSYFTSFEDPSMGVARMYVCNPENVVYRNPTGFCTPEIDEAFRGAMQSSDRAVRAEHFVRAAKLIQETLGTMPLVEEDQFNIGRVDRWDMGRFQDLHPYDWSALGAIKK